MPFQHRFVAELVAIVAAHHIAVAHGGIACKGHIVANGIAAHHAPREHVVVAPEPSVVAIVDGEARIIEVTAKSLRVHQQTGIEGETSLRHKHIVARIHRDIHSCSHVGERAFSGCTSECLKFCRLSHIAACIEHGFIANVGYRSHIHRAAPKPPLHLGREAESARLIPGHAAVALHRAVGVVAYAEVVLIAMPIEYLCRHFQRIAVEVEHRLHSCIK